MYAIKTPTTRTAKALIIKVGLKAVAHSYTDDWDELTANDVNWLIVDANLPEQGWSRAEDLTTHYKQLFKLGYADDDDDDDY